MDEIIVFFTFLYLLHADASMVINEVKQEVVRPMALSIYHFLIKRVFILVYFFIE